jgi:hypothetical protein
MRSPLPLGLLVAALVVASQPACFLDDDLPACGEPPSSFDDNGDLGVVAIGPENHRAYRIVFVPVGHTDDELDDFTDYVDWLTTTTRNDPESIVGRRPELFDFARATRSVRSSDGSWPCLDKEEQSTRLHLSVPEVVTAKLLEGMPGRTVVVEITPRGGGAANADRARELGADERTSIRMVQLDSARVFDHELGHAIVGLADEYTEDDANGCYPHPLADLPAGAPQPFPNLSPHADGRDWNGLVSGAEEGGGAYYDACIFHPTDECRMLISGEDHFCPVCNAAIHRALSRAAGEIGNPNQPPACVVTSTRDDERLHVRVVSWSFVPPLEVTVEFLGKDGRKTKTYGFPVHAPHLVDHRVDVELEDLAFPVRVLCTDGTRNVAVEKIER